MKMYINAHVNKFLRGMYTINTRPAIDPEDFVTIGEIEIDDDLLPTPEQIDEALCKHNDKIKADKIRKLRNEIEKLEGDL